MLLFQPIDLSSFVKTDWQESFSARFLGGATLGAEIGDKLTRRKGGCSIRSYKLQPEEELRPRSERSRDDAHSHALKAGAESDGGAG